MGLITEEFFDDTLQPFCPGNVFYPYSEKVNSLLADRLNATCRGLNSDQVTKLVIWDWDDTCGPLYPVADLTAHGAFLKLSKVTSTDYEHIASIARTIPGEFICHEPRSMLALMARDETVPENMQSLCGDFDNHLRFRHPAIESIVTEWERLRREMFRPLAQGAFSQVKETMSAVKASGGHDIIISSSIPGSLKRRMFETFGGVTAEDFMAKNILAVMCRDQIPGLTESPISYNIPSRSPELNEAEVRFRAFLDRPKADHQTSYGDHLRYFTLVKEPNIKGAPEGRNILLRGLAIANALTESYIKPDECIKIGDTESDYKAAQAADMRFILTTEGTVVNPHIQKMHRDFGCQKKTLGPEAVYGDVMGKTVHGVTARKTIIPDHVIARSSEVLRMLRFPNPQS